MQLGLIKELRLACKSWSYPYSLIFNKDKYLSPAVKKLMNLVRLRMIKLALEME
jgi:hypothetical protein